MHHKHKYKKTSTPAKTKVPELRDRSPLDESLLDSSGVEEWATTLLSQVAEPDSGPRDHNYSKLSGHQPSPDTQLILNRISKVEDLLKQDISSIQEAVRSWQ